MAKQNVVFQVNVIDQVIVQLCDPGVERTPGIAGALRWAGVIAKLHQLLQHFPVLGVLCAHHAYGLRHKGISTGFEHGKQDVLFLYHVG